MHSWGGWVLARVELGTTLFHGALSSRMTFSGDGIGASLCLLAEVNSHQRTPAQTVDFFPTKVAVTAFNSGCSANIAKSFLPYFVRLLIVLGQIKPVMARRQ
jgi:hypothetical protein